MRRCDGVCEPYFSSYVRKSISGSFSAAHQPEHRLRRLGDRDEEDPSVGIGVDRDVGAGIVVGHTVGDGVGPRPARGRTAWPRRPPRRRGRRPCWRRAGPAAAPATTIATSTSSEIAANGTAHGAGGGSAAEGTARCRPPPPSAAASLTFGVACRSTISPFERRSSPGWRSSPSCSRAGVRLPGPRRKRRAERRRRRARCRSRSSASRPRRITRPTRCSGSWPCSASGGLALLVGAVIATVSAFAIAVIVTTMTNLLKD